VARLAPRVIDALRPGSLEVGGMSRSYMLVHGPEPESPLLIVLHGLGTSGKDMVTFTGLARRGPAAGFATVFSDGWKQMWDGERRVPDRQHVDDPGFMVALVERLVAARVARQGPVFVAGISNGALFAEHLARHALLDVAGLALVAGSTTEESRRRSPCPAQAAAVVCLAGTADRSMPFNGGPMSRAGLLGRMAAHRAGRKRGEPAPVVVAAETVAGDWAAANGISSGPRVDDVPGQPESLPVTRLRWSAPRRPPVVLYRIEGGGHSWPGGPQYLPARFIGPVARSLDATGILLEMARNVVSYDSDDFPR
jgi:polyhydroxybutyrate depolymerase